MDLRDARTASLGSAASACSCQLSYLTQGLRAVVGKLRAFVMAPTSTNAEYKDLLPLPGLSMKQLSHVISGFTSAPKLADSSGTVRPDAQAMARFSTSVNTVDNSMSAVQSAKSCHHSTLSRNIGGVGHEACMPAYLNTPCPQVLSHRASKNNR